MTLLFHTAERQQGFRYDASMTFSLYKNKVGKLADPFFEGTRQRIEPFNRSVTGKPISSFFGYQLDGFYDDAAELATQVQAGKFIGGWKYKDLSGPNGKPDGIISIEDRTFIGNPHPDFIMGFNLILVTKILIFPHSFTGKLVVRLLIIPVTGQTLILSRVEEIDRVLYDSWTPDNKNAKLPRLMPMTDPAVQYR